MDAHMGIDESDPLIRKLGDIGAEQLGVVGNDRTVKMVVALVLVEIIGQTGE